MTTRYYLNTLIRLVENSEQANAGEQAVGFTVQKQYTVQNQHTAIMVYEDKMLKCRAEMVD